MSRSKRFGASSLFQGALGWVALFITLAASVPLGANRPVSWIIVSTLLIVLLALQFCRDVLTRAPHERAGRLWLAAVPMFLAFGWAMVQIFPSLTAIASTYVGQDLADPAWLAVEVPGTISADPIEGRHAALRLFSYLALFWIAVRAGENADRAEAMVKVTGLYIALLSAYGLVALVTGENRIVGEDGAGPVTATFINRNSFATYAAFGVAIHLAVILTSRMRAGGTRTQRLRGFLEGFFSGGWVFILGFLVCAVSLMASQSRGGALAMAAGIAMVFAAYRGHGARGGGPVIWIVLVAVAFVVFTSATGVIGRFVTTETENVRFVVYDAIVEAIKERPFTGYGLGSFQDVFRSFVPIAGAGGEWDKAHNTYLEMVFELGLPAAILFYLALALVALRIARGALTRQRHLLVPLAALGVIAAGAVHSLFDFSLQIPAIAMAFAFVTGLGYIQAFRQREV